MHHRGSENPEVYRVHGLPFPLTLPVSRMMTMSDSCNTSASDEHDLRSGINCGKYWKSFGPL